MPVSSDAFASLAIENSTVSKTGPSFLQTKKTAATDDTQKYEIESMDDNGLIMVLCFLGDYRVCGLIMRYVGLLIVQGQASKQARQ